MSFAFSPRRSARKSLRVIATHRLRASLDILDGPAPGAADQIHELRKNIKKLRALLRLFRPAFDGFSRENAALREAGQALSALREGTVLLSTFDALGRPDPQLRARLAASVRNQPADTAAALARHREILGGVLDRAPGWRCTAKGFDAIAPGLARSWTEARRQMEGALVHPRGDVLHEWRKRVKDHGYHARLLEPVWPAMMECHIRATERLGDLLGEARDLALLAETVEALGGGAIIEDARREEATRLAAASDIARRLFSEPAPRLVHRWRSWWDLWRREPPPG